MKKRNFKKAFTLVELMVVVALGAILLTLSFVSANRARIKTRDKTRVADINTIRLAIEEYKLHCGEYPNKIALNTNNGCHNGEKLGDYLRQIPVNPKSINHQWDGVSEITGSNGYMYAGLAKKPAGKCFNYHIAVGLENGGNFLKEDHDAAKGVGSFKYNCMGSNPDFGWGAQDDEDDLYDLRANNAS